MKPKHLEGTSARARHLKMEVTARLIVPVVNERALILSVINDYLFEHEKDYLTEHDGEYGKGHSFEASLDILEKESLLPAKCELFDLALKALKISPTRVAANSSIMPELWLQSCRFEPDFQKPERSRTSAWASIDEGS